MDLNQAILAHQQWKSRLNQFLGGSSQEVLDPATTGKDDQCELGKWIHGEGRREFRDEPAFLALHDCHEHFHRKAGEVVKMVRLGHVKEAQEIYDREFPQDSKEIALSIHRLKKLVPTH